MKAGGAGFVIYLSETHYLCFSMGCGSSSNARAELLALWVVLRVSHLMGLPMRSIFGDSMVIISWINELSALDLPTLIHWCEDIKYMKRLAPQVIFMHIVLEHNMLADSLSKQAVNLNIGFALFTEYLDGKAIENGHYSIF